MTRSLPQIGFAESGREVEAKNPHPRHKWRTLPRAKGTHRGGDLTLPPVLFTGGIEGGQPRETRERIHSSSCVAAP